MTAVENIRAQPKPVVLLLCLAAMAGISFVDFTTRWEMSFFVFYAIPIFVVASTCSRGTAIGFAVLCAGASWAVNLHLAPDFAIHTWRSLNRLASFAFVAIAGAALRSQREHFRAQIDALQHSRELEQEIIRVSEREQRRIGQDLHDSVCQNLAAIDCAAGMLKSKLEAQASHETGTATEIQQMLKKTLLETRSLARGIFPVQLDEDGLAVAIEELVTTVNRFNKVAVSIEIDGDVVVKDSEIAMHLFRIAQEALNNALRHAGATAIRVSLRQEGSRVSLAIKDNGSGIPDTAPSGMGFGTIKYRTQLIGADLKVISNSTTGTVVQCAVTLPNSDAQN